jgi:Bromodomain
MDLSTIRRKLDNNEYANVLPFFTDFKLMIRNCFSYNQPSAPVNQAGVDLQRVFDEKWKNLPVLAAPRPMTDDGTDEGMEPDEDERRAYQVQVHGSL